MHSAHLHKLALEAVERGLALEGQVAAGERGGGRGSCVLHSDAEPEQRPQALHLGCHPQRGVAGGGEGCGVGSEGSSVDSGRLQAQSAEVLLARHVDGCKMEEEEEEEGEKGNVGTYLILWALRKTV